MKVTLKIFFSISFILIIFFWSSFDNDEESVIIDENLISEKESNFTQEKNEPDQIEISELIHTEVLPAIPNKQDKFEEKKLPLENETLDSIVSFEEKKLPLVNETSDSIVSEKNSEDKTEQKFEDELEFRSDRLWYEIGSTSPYTGIVIRKNYNGSVKSKIQINNGVPFGMILE